MKLSPFLQVDDTPFSASPEFVQARRGAPLRRQRNAVALTEWDYGDTVFRFQDNGQLEEVTRRAPLLYLLTADGVADIPFGGLAGFVRAQDAGVFERAGFLVSPRFGLAFVPGEPDWVTALAPHCLDTWRHLGSADAV